MSHASGVNVRSRAAPVACIVLAAALVIAGLAIGVANDSALVQVDQMIYTSLQSWRSPVADQIFVTFTEIGGMLVVTSVTIALAFWLLLKGAWRAALALLIIVGTCSVLNTAIKVLVARSRPVEGLYTGWSAFAFPSGHASLNAALYGFVALLIARELRLLPTIMVTAATLAFVGAVSYSRLYLGAHWFSDVAGGLALAVAWTLMPAFVYLRCQPPRIDAKGLAFVTLLALTLAGGANVMLHHARDMVRYAVAPGLTQIKPLPELPKQARLIGIEVHPK